LKRLLRVTAVLSALLVLLVIFSVSAVWLLRDTIALTVANRLLHDTNLRVAELVGIQPTSTRTTIRELSVELRDSGRLQQFSDIEFTYTVVGLRNAQIDTIRITSAELDMPFDTETSDVTTDVPRLTTITELIRQAPIQSIHIDQLLLNNRPMSLSLYRQPDRLTGQMGDELTNVQLQMDWHPAPDQSFTATLRAQSASLPVLEIELDVQARDNMLHLQTYSHVATDSAHAVLEALADLMSLPPLPELPLSATTDVSIQAQLPDTMQIPQTLDLTAILGAGGNVQLPSSLFADSGVGAVEFRWQEPVTLVSRLQGPGSTPEFTVSGNQMSLAIPSIITDTIQVTGAAATLDNYELNCLDLTDCQFSASSTLRAESAQASLPDNNATQLILLVEPSVFIPRLTGILSDNVVSLQTLPDLHLSLSQVAHPALSAWNSEATFQSAASLDIPLGSIDDMRLTADALAISLPVLRTDESMTGFQLHIRDLDTMPLAPSRLTATLTLSNAYTNLFSLNLWNAALTTDISLENNIAAFNTAVTLNGRTAATANGRHNLETRSGQGQMEIPDVTFDDVNNRLTDFISPLPVTADLLAGTLSGNAELQWQLPETQATPTVSGIVDLTLTDVGGFYETLGFVDLSTRIHAHLGEDLQLRSLSEQHLRLGRLDVGLGIEDIEAHFQFNTEGPTVSLHEASMALFGGRVLADRLDYDAAATENTNTLILDSIDIARVMSLSAYEGVSATGIVNGQIPLTISGTQFTVNAGRLAAVPPGGTISYRDGPTNTGNTSLDMVYSALRNYRYSRLEADVDYLADGELLLSVRMEGIAPEVGSGQRINLNVNISDNIPDLLESLQAGRNIADSLEQQYRAQQ